MLIPFCAEITMFSVYLLVAASAKAHEIVLVIGSTFCKRDDVVDFFHITMRTRSYMMLFRILHM